MNDYLEKHSVDKLKETLAKHFNNVSKIEKNTNFLLNSFIL